MDPLAIKPGLVRADTIDLQSQQNPSAKDHTRQPYQQQQQQQHYGYSHVGSVGSGTHHAQALRHATQDAFNEQRQSPRVDQFHQNHVGQYGQGRMYADGDDEDEDDENDDEHPNHGPNGMSHHDGEYGEEEDNDSQDEMDDEMLDKISSSPSIEDEDIDFEFVYALHTFVATVEGQANATKGDTMVLLDDSNSYWWLVRLVKDGSIGYLPAEHIETPTERLARLNKHRNIDLSASLLGDNIEKSKNPLKKAMRRRNAKTVNFAPPTYYEPPDQEWSDDQDMDDVDDSHLESTVAGMTDDRQDVQSTTKEHSMQQTAAQQQQQKQQIQHTQNGVLVQQPRQVDHPSQAQDVTPHTVAVHQTASEMSEDDEEPSSPSKNLQQGDLVQNGDQEQVKRSRQGVVRNTDSFYNDTSVETKKISLTPQLLRGDSAINVATDPELKERKSAETFDKIIAEDRSKDAKQKKEKKGMLSGLFKRKDKSGKGGRNEDEADRSSEDSNRTPQSKESLEVAEVPERKPSKLQKTAPVIDSKTSPVEVKSLQQSIPTQSTPGTAIQTNPEPKQPVRPLHLKQASKDLLTVDSQHPPGRFPSLNEKRSVFAPITTALRSKTSNQEVGDSIKPVYSKRAKERFAIDESDSEDDKTPTAQTPTLRHSVSPLEPQDLLNSRPDSMARVSPLLTDVRDVSAVNDPTSPVSPVKAHPLQHSQTSASMTATSPSDMAMSEQTTSTAKHSPSTTQTSTTSRLTPTWSDASLRSYMDDDQDIRDLLIIVHDKSNVTPVGPDHPLMNGLFAAERTKLNEMQTQLDSMLMTWLAKKNAPTTIKV